MKELNYSIYWSKICQIYLLTKHYLILGEELSTGFDTFIQPLKEERDAFDHIVRVYGRQYSNRKVDDVERYCKSNMRKAVQHTYRAFFDTADFFTYVCQKRIRELLVECKRSREEIIEVYPGYEKARELLERLPREIAEIRENKDESESEDELVDEVMQYKAILDEVYNIYFTINHLFSE